MKSTTFLILFLLGCPPTLCAQRASSRKTDRLYLDRWLIEAKKMDGLPGIQKSLAELDDSISEPKEVSGYEAPAPKAAAKTKDADIKALKESIAKLEAERPELLEALSRESDFYRALELRRKLSKLDLEIASRKLALNHLIASR